MVFSPEATPGVPTAVPSVGAPTGARSSWRDQVLDRSLDGARARSDERIARFVAAARDLATESGSSSFTVQQVVARSGQSLKSFYRYFDGKDDLLLALIEEDSAMGAALLADAIRHRRTPQTRARAWVRGMLELMGAGGYGYVSVLLREHRRLAEERPVELDLALRPFVVLLAEALADGMADGTVRRGDAHRDARLVLNLVIVTIHDLVFGLAAPSATAVDRPTGTDRGPQIAEAADYVWSFCWGGLEGTRP